MPNGMVASIQADLDSITDSLAALAEIERELDDERRKAAGFKWLLDQQRGVVPPGPDRWKERSRTFAGIAEAMADQWGWLPCAEMAAA